MLSSGERAAIANANVADHQEHFESRTQTGKLVPMAYLQRIVFSGMAVAAIKQRASASARPGSGETVGTGFLVDGAAFGYSDDHSYMLTNAHVIWDPARGPGQEDNALSPAAVEIMFDGGGGGANEVYADPVVLWQSQSCLHDATLVALPRKVTGIKPLTISLNRGQTYRGRRQRQGRNTARGRGPSRRWRVVDRAVGFDRRDQRAPRRQGVPGKLHRPGISALYGTD